MIVYFSTVVRGAPIAEGGELVKLDWQRKNVVGRVPIHPTDPSVDGRNPRGGTRGGRGILLNGHELFVASYHSLHVFDRELRPISRVSHPLFANLHEICWHGDQIWATSTEIDAAIRVDRTGNTVEAWWPREDPVTAAHFDLPAFPIDKTADNRMSFVDQGPTQPGHVHLNAVAVQNGRPLMLLNRFGCLVRLNPTEVLVQDPALKGCHNVVVTSDGSILINNTVQKALHVYDASGRLQRRISLVDLAPVRSILRRHMLAEAACWMARNGWPKRMLRHLLRHIVAARPVFVRGLCESGPDRVMVGISPATLLEINWRTGDLIDFFTYSNDREVCVHGIACEQQPVTTSGGGRSPAH